MENIFDKPYDPSKTEEKIYELWEKSGYFNPDNLPAQAGLPGDRKESFTIAIAPPNVTGSLHMGHALENTLSDILIRYHRMKGYKTLWIPGTDHAGIATQNAVEKQLKKEGISRHDLGREKFLEKIWEWKEKYGNIILNQLKKLGASCDWSRTRFTMDENYAEAVREVFNHYHKKGWIYQGDKVVNWCIKDATSLSDLELEYQEEKGKLWYIKYPIKDGGFITIATTRPETMLGDSAIAVNPKDKKYEKLIGKTAILPIINREIPIMADEFVEKDFGTGAVKVTPAHDFADADMGERHNLPKYQVINEKGRMTEIAGKEFEGLKIEEAREKVLEKIKELGLLEKEEDYVHNVARCYRCNTIIEPLISKQWFLKINELVKPAIDAIENEKIKYYPERWKDISLDWLKNIKDWCISRQIWWGHKIPIEGSNDVLDTWFSSALWPFATLGWPQKTGDLKTFYPTSFITSARDILHLWISRMIFSGLELTGEVPFHNVLIHGTILAKDGRRMSKSLGTGVDPLELIQKYGADATRFGLVWQSMGGQDIHWTEEHVLAGKKFINKIWNIARFVLKQTEISNFQFKPSGDSSKANSKQFSNLKLSNENKEIVEKIKSLVKKTEKQLDSYEFGQALHDIYEFVWHDFADKFIEYSKDKDDDEIKNVLSWSLMSILKLTHPFMPFVTEEIYQQLPAKHGKMLMVENWPK